MGATSGARTHTHASAAAAAIAVAGPLHGTLSGFLQASPVFDQSDAGCDLFGSYCCGQHTETQLKCVLSSKKPSRVRVARAGGVLRGGQFCRQPETWADVGGQVQAHQLLGGHRPRRPGQEAQGLAAELGGLAPEEHGRQTADGERERVGRAGSGGGGTP